MFVSELKQAVLNKFEGGIALSIDWNSVIREASDAMLSKIAPDSLRVVDLLDNGIHSGNAIKNLPVTIIVAPRCAYMVLNLTDRNTGKNYTYKHPNEFDKLIQYGEDVFTMRHINGAPVLYIKKDTDINTSVQFADFSDPSSKTGVSLKQTSYITIANDVALLGNFTDAAYSIQETFTNPVDISNFKDGGVITFSLYIDNPAAIDSIELKLYKDVNNYITFKDNSPMLSFSWNFVKFNFLFDAQTLGTVDQVNSYELNLRAINGASFNAAIDIMQLSKSYPFYAEYVSKCMFVCSSTGQPTQTPTSDTDILLIDDTEAFILAYEMARIISFSSTQAKAKAKEDFISVLSEKYNDYYRDNDDTFKPRTYFNKLDIDKDFGSIW